MKRTIAAILIFGLSLLLVCLLGTAPVLARPYEPPTASSPTPIPPDLPDWLVPRVLLYTRMIYRTEPEVDPAVVLAVIAVESMGNEFMIGQDGELGPMQVRAVLWAGTREQLSDELYNIRTGVNILEENVAAHGLRDGLAFYNCGPRSLESRCGDAYAALVLRHVGVFQDALETYDPPDYLWDADGIRAWLEGWGY